MNGPPFPAKSCKTAEPSPTSAAFGVHATSRSNSMDQDGMRYTSAFFALNVLLKTSINDGFQRNVRSRCYQLTKLIVPCDCERWSESCFGSESHQTRQVRATSDEERRFHHI